MLPESTLHALCRPQLAPCSLRIACDRRLLCSQVIDKKKLIDQHYYAIASKATILKPAQLNVPADKFKDKFGEDWQVRSVAHECKPWMLAQTQTQAQRRNATSRSARRSHSQSAHGAPSGHVIRASSSRPHSSLSLRVQAALDAGKVLNAADACEKFGLGAEELGKATARLLTGGGGRGCVKQLPLRGRQQGLASFYRLS